MTSLAVFGKVSQLCAMISTMPIPTSNAPRMPKTIKSLLVDVIWFAVIIRGNFLSCLFRDNLSPNQFRKVFEKIFVHTGDCLNRTG